MEPKPSQSSPHSLRNLTGRNGILLELCVLMTQEANLKGKRRATITQIANIDGIPDATTSFNTGATLGMAVALAMEAAQAIPLAEIIHKKLTEGQKKRLVGSICGFFTKVHFDDVAGAMAFLNQDPKLKATVLTRIKSHFKQELKYNIH